MVVFIFTPENIVFTIKGKAILQLHKIDLNVNGIK